MRTRPATCRLTSARLQIQTARRIDELLQDDLDEFAEACLRHICRTGSSHRPRLSVISDTQPALLQIGILDSLARSGGEVRSRSGTRSHLTDRGRGDGLPGTQEGNMLCDPTTVRDLGQRRHIESWLTSLLEVVTESTHIPPHRRPHPARGGRGNVYHLIAEWAGMPPGREGDLPRGNLPQCAPDSARL